MNFDEIINALEDLVENSWNLPMAGGKSVIDGAQILEFVEDMRMALPEEIKRSRQIMAQRDDIISRAKSEAETVLNAAHTQAKKLVSEQEISKMAQAKAQEIDTNAQNAARETRASALEYCDSLLERCEDALKGGLTSVTETRKNLKRSSEK